MACSRVRVTDRKLVFAPPGVLNAARVRENCFFIVALTSHRFWPILASGLMGVKPRIENNWGGEAAGGRVAFRGLAPYLRRGGASRRRAQPARPAGGSNTAGLNRLRRFRNPGRGPHRHTVRRCMDPVRPLEAAWAAGRARRPSGGGSFPPPAGHQSRR